MQIENYCKHKAGWSYSCTLLRIKMRDKSDSGSEQAKPLLVYKRYEWATHFDEFLLQNPHNYVMMVFQDHVLHNHSPDLEHSFLLSFTIF